MSLPVEQYVEFTLGLAESYAVMEAGRITRSGSTNSVALASFAELLAVELPAAAVGGAGRAQSSGATEGV